LALPAAKSAPIRDNRETLIPILGRSQPDPGRRAIAEHEPSGRDSERLGDGPERRVFRQTLAPR
jgi:hypothetical protein